MATECSSKLTDLNNNLNDSESYRIKTKSIENTLLPLVSQVN